MLYDKKVIWAVDPFSKEGSLQVKTFKALEAFTSGMNVTIEPVAILSPDQLGIPLAVFDNYASFHQAEAETILQRWLTAIDSDRLAPVKFLTHKEFSLRSTVRTLVDYAHDCGATLIGLSSHAKRAWQRIFVGSFAESLMLHSDVPLFVYSAKSKAPPRFRKFLFPTDFSKASEEAFQKILPIAKTRGADLVLYHKLEYLVPQTVDVINFNPSYLTYIQDDERDKRALADAWVRVATEAGVETEPIVDDRPGFITESILSIAKKRDVDMITMASSSGGVGAVILGSIARDVLRKVTCPVWVIHPTEKKQRLRAVTPGEEVTSLPVGRLG